MADTGWQTISGEGELLLAGAVTISDLQFYIDTPSAAVEYRSSFVPRRVMHVGWIATASGIGGVASASLALSDLAVTSLNYFQFEAELKHLPSNFQYDDRIIWHITPSVVCKFIAFW